VDRGDRGLQLVRAWPAQSERPLDEPNAFGYSAGVPERAILFFSVVAFLFLLTRRTRR
jgi:hypothetical protein